jgi:hypothetical protein
MYCSQTPSQWLLRTRYRLTRAQGNLDANRQERMIRADFIAALSWDWPIMPCKVMQGRPEGYATACCTADLCLAGVGTKDHRRFLPCSIAQIAANATTCQTISQEAVSHPYIYHLTGGGCDPTGATAKANLPLLQLSAESLGYCTLPERISFATPAVPMGT